VRADCVQLRTWDTQLGPSLGPGSELTRVGVHPFANRVVYPFRSAGAVCRFRGAVARLGIPDDAVSASVRLFVPLVKDG
jgi:hypothetical protein